MNSNNNFPQLPSKVPQRGSQWIKGFFKQLFLAQGWKIQGEFPNLAKAVAIISPHTSNLDAWYGFNALLGLDIHITVFGKDSLFHTPLKPLLKWIGVVPVVRESPQGYTQEIIEKINQSQGIWVGMAPEGTRKRADRIRSGFYHIATGANIPIVMFAFDYANKSIKILGVFYPTGDYQADLNAILHRYSGEFSAKNPAWLAQPLQNSDKNP